MVQDIQPVHPGDVVVRQSIVEHHRTPMTAASPQDLLTIGYTPVAAYMDPEDHTVWAMVTVDGQPRWVFYSTEAFNEPT